MSGIERRRTASSFDDRARQMGPTFWKMASRGGARNQPLRSTYTSESL
jgi:hypothetical protein